MMLRYLKMIKFMYHINTSFLPEKISKINQNTYNFFRYQATNFNLSCRIHLKSHENKGKNSELKIPRIPKIMLILPDKSVSYIFLQEAQKLAKRRNLKLEKVQTNTQAERDVYKLTDTIKDFLESEKPKKDETNCEKFRTKLFVIKSTIQNHDLNVKLNNINKILDKKNKIKIIINFTEKMQEQFLENIKEKVQGILLKAKVKKNSAILIYESSLNNRISNLEDDTDKNKEINSKKQL